MPIPSNIEDFIKKSSSPIKKLDLSNFGFMDGDIEELVTLLQGKIVGSLKLSNNNITAVGAKKLAVLIISKLDISNNALGNTGAEILKKSTTIEQLKLKGNGISSAIMESGKKNKQDNDSNLLSSDPELLSLMSVRHKNLSIYPPLDCEQMESFSTTMQESALVKEKTYEGHMKSYLSSETTSPSVQNGSFFQLASSSATESQYEKVSPGNQSAPSADSIINKAHKQKSALFITLDQLPLEQLSEELKDLQQKIEALRATHSISPSLIKSQ